MSLTSESATGNSTATTANPTIADVIGSLVDDPTTTPIISTITANLTTTFTPAPSCSATFTLAPAGIDNATFANNGDLFVNVGVDPACYPPSFYLATPTSSYWTYYSPAGLCPSGWMNVQQTAFVSTTQVVCCPSGLGYEGIAASGRSTSACYGQAGTITLVNGSSTTTFTPGSVTLEQSPVMLAWESKDVSLWSTTSSSSVPTSPSTITPSTSTTTASVASSSPSTSTASSTPTASTLSTGAQAGIGVGSAAGGLALLGALAFVLLRAKRRKTKQAADYIAKAELPGQGVEKPRANVNELGEDEQLYEADGVADPAEAGGDARMEADGASRPVEAGDTVRAELEGDWRGYEAPGDGRT